MDLTITDEKPNLESSDKPCFMAHMIGGMIPDFSNPILAEQYVGSVCDCGKFKVIKQPCSCPGIPFKITFIDNA